MALRFLADHCVSNFTVQNLRESNHEVLCLRHVLPVESADALVIARAQEIDAILLSLNGDFADIVKYPPTNYTSIKWHLVARNPSRIDGVMIACYKPTSED
jgi:predicted nuclease of predicted toxin-antitoxin system